MKKKKRHDSEKNQLGKASTYPPQVVPQSKQWSSQPASATSLTNFTSKITSWCKVRCAQAQSQLKFTRRAQPISMQDCLSICWYILSLWSGHHWIISPLFNLHDQRLRVESTKRTGGSRNREYRNAPEWDLRSLRTNHLESSLIRYYCISQEP
jgi:hypothetical protein